MGALAYHPPAEEDLDEVPWRGARGASRMFPLAIGLAGRIGSGKSTIVRQLSHRLDGVSASFGDYVRAEARSRGLAGSREELQGLGDLLISEYGWDLFCRKVLLHCGWDPGSAVVIDGVRHVEVVASLRRLVAPSRFVLVYVTIDERVRATRLPHDLASDLARLTGVDSHSTEVQVTEGLLSAADLVVDGQESPEEIVETIATWITPEAKPVADY